MECHFSTTNCFQKGLDLHSKSLVILVLATLVLKSKLLAKRRKTSIAVCSKIPLHKNFKLVLQQNVMNQTYHKI